ncbi:MAG: hypothetical protein KDD44_00675, partial [Bdellovibrionales bacterium]|nr:hypothetical protein [Bdellovibrionales bacterium]
MIEHALTWKRLRRWFNWTGAAVLLVAAACPMMLADESGGLLNDALSLANPLAASTAYAENAGHGGEASAAKSHSSRSRSRSSRRSRRPSKKPSVAEHRSKEP